MPIYYLLVNEPNGIYLDGLFEYILHNMGIERPIISIPFKYTMPKSLSNFHRYCFQMNIEHVNWPGKGVGDGRRREMKFPFEQLFRAMLPPNFSRIHFACINQGP